MIRYEFATGEVIEIEVPQDLEEVIIEIEKTDYNKNRAETRRHESYNQHNDKRETLVDKRTDIETEIQNRFEYENLHKAISQLQPQQQELVHKVFFEGKSITAVAKELGVTKQACNNRLNKIYKQLKKHF